MSTKLLLGEERIDNLNIVVMDDLKKKNPEMFNESGSMDDKLFEKHIRPYNYIYLRHDVNSLTFNFKKDENSKGCELQTLIMATKIMLANTKRMSREKSLAMTKLDEALMWLDKEIKNSMDD